MAINTTTLMKRKLCKRTRKSVLKIIEHIFPSSINQYVHRITHCNILLRSMYNFIIILYFTEIDPCEGNLCINGVCEEAIDIDPKNYTCNCMDTPYFGDFCGKYSCKLAHREHLSGVRKPCYRSNDTAYIEKTRRG